MGETLEDAVRSGDLQRVQVLIRSGADVNEWCEGQGSLLNAAISAGHRHIALALLSAGADVHTPDDRGQSALQWACALAWEDVVQAIIDRGGLVDKPYGLCAIRRLISSPISSIPAFLPTAEKASSKCGSQRRSTPLMDATCNGNENIVKILILAGATVGMQNENGDTALHLAASHKQIECGILLAEGGASVRTKNNDLKTPFDLATEEFKEAIEQALSFTTRKTLCVIGNAESGKSTLIATLQARASSFLGKLVNWFKKVDDKRKRTAGIETVPHCSQRYGEVLFYDFAGQDEYCGPHQIFLESLLSKAGVSTTLLLVVKGTQDKEDILHQLDRWLSPVALMSTNKPSPPQVIVVGSFFDKVRSKQEATVKLHRCVEAIRKDLLPLEFVDICMLNCRQPQSAGMDQLCRYLKEIPIPEFRATHTQYSLAWVLFQIRSSFKSRTVRLQELSTWIQDNKSNLPQTLPPPEEVCRDLSAAGHALYLSNKEDPTKSWLVLDLPSILRDVYGTIFSNSKGIVNEFGLLPYEDLAKLFIDLDLEIVRQLLISMEFCIPLDPSIQKSEVSKLTQSEEASGWLFFPALISAKFPQSKLVCTTQKSDLCWQLKTSRKYPILARIHQTILLRLAAHFVVIQPNKEGVMQPCCSIWQKGIAWQSKKGVDVTVHISDRVVQVVGVSVTSAEESHKYMTKVISDILATVRQVSPSLMATAYILHPPPRMAALCEVLADPPPQELFPVADIQNSVKECDKYSLSLKDSDNHSIRIPVADLFGGCTPSLEDIDSIHWTQPEPSHSQSPAIVTISPATDTSTSTHPPPADVTTSTCSPTAPSAAKVLTPVQGAQALLDLSSVPNMRDVSELILTEIAAKWQKVAFQLGVEDCVTDIASANHHKDCEGACRDMLKRWLRKERHTGQEKRTWSTLLTKLGRAGFVDLETSLRREQFKLPYEV